MKEKNEEGVLLEIHKKYLRLSLASFKYNLASLVKFLCC